MVLPIKVFEIVEEIEFGLLIQKLRDYREENLYEKESGEKVSLLTEITDLNLNGSTILGVLCKDYMSTRVYKRSFIEDPVTEEAPFWILTQNNRRFLIVLAPSVARGVKRLLTGTVANILSRILFISTGGIIEVKIPSETLQKTHESNPQATRLIWFDQVDIPGVEKLCLAGSDIVETTLYKDYLKHGQIWYVVFEVQQQGIVVGMTRNCVVTLFSKSTTDEFVNYIQENILHLIE